MTELCTRPANGGSEADHVPGHFLIERIFRCFAPLTAGKATPVTLGVPFETRTEISSVLRIFHVFIFYCIQNALAAHRMRFVIVLDHPAARH